MVSPAESEARMFLESKILADRSDERDQLEIT